MKYIREILIRSLFIISSRNWRRFDFLI